MLYIVIRETVPENTQVYVVDADGPIADDLNKANMRMLGCDKEADEVVVKRVLDLLNGLSPAIDRKRDGEFNYYRIPLTVYQEARVVIVGEVL